MKVLHVSANLEHGAGQGAFLLHQALRQKGTDSNFLAIADPPSPIPHVFGLESSLLKRLRRITKTHADRLPLHFYPDRRAELFSPGFLGHDITRMECYRQADVINLHWINHAMLSPRTIGKIDKPFVWTMRDMWPFTGGCHYSFDCERYQRECGKCPLLGSQKLHDLSFYALRNKQNHFPSGMHLVGISQWLSECAAQSAAINKPNIKTINNGIDTEQFKPIPQEEARKQLHIPLDKPVLLLGATNLEAAYKGFDYFETALHKLQEQDVVCCFFGSLSSERAEALNVPFKSMGKVSDIGTLNALYSAADCFVAPSIAEAFGKTLVESLASNTPVVCFDVMGPKDIIQHKRSGYRACFKDAVDLSEGIRWVLKNSATIKTSGICRADAVKCFDLTEAIAPQYIELYRRILAEKK